MGIQEKHAYRFGYLKSEEWKTVRIEALAKAKAICQICGFQSTGNDCHHVYYPPSFWKTKSDDLVVLCRECHEIVEALIPHSKSKDECTVAFAEIAGHLQKWLQSVKIRSGQTAPEVTIEGKLLQCVVCRKHGADVEKHDLFLTYPDCQLEENRLWSFCPECFGEFTRTMDWPKNSDGKGVFVAARKTSDALRRNLKLTKTERTSSRRIRS